METLSITTEKLNSANIAVKSEGWTDYEIKANISVSNEKVTSIDNGRVTRLSDRRELASFNTNGPGGPSSNLAGNDNTTYNYWVSDTALKCEIIQRIDEFIAALRAKTFTPSNLSF